MVPVVAVAVVVVGGCWRYVVVLVLNRHHYIRCECPRDIELVVVCTQCTVLNIIVSRREL